MKYGYSRVSRDGQMLGGRADFDREVIRAGASEGRSRTKARRSPTALRRKSRGGSLSHENDSRLNAGGFYGAGI